MKAKKKQPVTKKVVASRPALKLRATAQANGKARPAATTAKASAAATTAKAPGVAATTKARSAATTVKARSAAATKANSAAATKANSAAATAKARPAAATANSEVDEYVSKVVPWQRTVIDRLRAVVKAAAPQAIESLKWGQPVYEHKGPFSYIKAHVTHINFGFWRGAELEDPKRVLQGEGERMRHVKIQEAQAVDEATIAALVKQAAALNDKKGDPTRAP